VGRFATGVAIVTTRLGEVDHAMTVNSFTSVSLEPLLVLFCAEKVARFHDAVLEAGVWGVSVLPASLEEASRFFAHRGRPLNGQLARWPHHRGKSGVALFDDALATVECRTHAVYPGGDHSVVVGAVEGVGTPGVGDSLIYHDGQYKELGPVPRRPGAGRTAPGRRESPRLNRGAQGVGVPVGSSGMAGVSVGGSVGWSVGVSVGTSVGVSVGTSVGTSVGHAGIGVAGGAVGSVGGSVGTSVGPVGGPLGTSVGPVGVTVTVGVGGGGVSVGASVGPVGGPLGVTVGVGGVSVGVTVGVGVGSGTGAG
jgi:flavin reductase (DIM6/NTAB) family NADH-FMN oxidoreductase RutF